jgi:hypothetical protein
MGICSVEETSHFAQYQCFQKTCHYIQEGKFVEPFWRLGVEKAEDTCLQPCPMCNHMTSAYVAINFSNRPVSKILHFGLQVKVWRKAKIS